MSLEVDADERMPERRRWHMVRIGLVLAFTALCISLPAAAQQPASPARAVTKPAPDTRVNPLAEEMVDFKKRIDAYLDLRKAIASKMPEVKETGDPAKISQREKALGLAIAKARASAKPGDIFGLKMSKYIQHALAEDWKTRSATDREAIFEEVPPNLELKNNQTYQKTIPLVSAQAKLLARLPTLPEELEYRLVDRRLLLRDRDANLIVDVIVGTLPKRVTK
jgi:hypothetical protein